MATFDELDVDILQGVLNTQLPPTVKPLENHQSKVTIKMTYNMDLQKPYEVLIMDRAQLKHMCKIFEDDNRYPMTSTNWEIVLKTPSLRTNFWTVWELLLWAAAPYPNIMQIRKLDVKVIVDFYLHFKCDYLMQLSLIHI